LQNIHPSRFEGGSVETALSQLEALYLGIKNIFLEARKAFVQQKTELFEIRVLVDNIGMIKQGSLFSFSKNPQTNSDPIRICESPKINQSP